MQKLLAALVLMTIGVFCQANNAMAQIHSIEVDTPRPAGWMVADVIPMRIRISVDASHPMQPASLPTRGPLNYWLELRDIRVVQDTRENIIRYVVDLDYQTFYVPLDVQEREIPALSLTFGEGDNTVTTTVDAWRFTVSPLRGIALHGSAQRVEPEPDAVQNVLSQRRSIGLTGLSAIILFITTALLLWHYAVWPFRVRPARPFSQAARAVREARRNGGEQAYRHALQHIHRALDASAERRVLADDLESFVQARPAFAGLQNGMAAFFRASRYAFFADDDSRAMDELPWNALVDFARHLAAAERRRA